VQPWYFSRKASNSSTTISGLHSYYILS